MKRASAPYAKVVRPVVKGVVARTRLFDRLDQMRERALIWVCGPAGCGKTILVGSYLESRRLPLLWYQVDAGDKDPATFFHYMGLAAERAAPRHRKPLPLLTPEYLPGLPTFTLRYFEALYGRLKTPSALVLDNLQELEGDTGFHELIRGGLSRLPQGLNAILISRNSPPPAFARMLANQEMTVLGWEELRLTQEESAEIIRRRSPEPPSQEDLLHFHRAADGWAAGLVLILEWARREKTGPQALYKATPEEILAYFGNEIFDTLDHPTQQFLLKTAILPRTTAKMAEEMTGEPAAGAILSRLSSQNSFTERRLDVDAVYQYHPLFRDFLLSRGKGFFRPEELSGLRRRAAVLLEEGGEIEAAASLCSESGDWEGLLALILKHAPALLASGRHRALEGWLNCLPGEVLAGTPWLLYWTAMCRLPFSPPQSHDFFEKAFQLFRVRRDAVGTFLSLSGLFDTITYGLGSFKPFDRTIELFEEALQEFRSFPSLEIEARLTASMLGNMVLRQPQHPDFESRAERALAVLQKTPDINVKLQILQTLATHRLVSGELSKAESVLDSFRELAQSPDVTPMLSIVLKDLEAFYYWLTGDFEENRNAATEGLELASATGIHLFDIFLLGHGAAGAISSGDMAAARAFLKKIAPHLDRTPPWGRGFYYALSTWASLLEGNLSKALSDGQLCQEFASEAGMPQTEAFSFVGNALALHESKRHQEAAKHIARAHALAHSARVPLAEFMCLLAQARMAFDRGDDRSGLAFLKKTLSLGREKGYVNTYYWQPPVMASLCKRALEAGIEVRYVQSIIRRRHLMPDPPPYECGLWPWPVRIYTLGRFELVKDGEPLSFSGKVKQKPLFLLKALIALRGKDVKEGQVSDALWPEADGDAAHSAFTTTLSRLRDLLGEEKAIRVQEGRTTLDARYCWVDAWTFERLLAEAETRLKDLREGRDQGAVRRPPLDDFVGKAAALYKGHFLLGDEAHVWTASYRERLRGKFLRLIVRWGDHLESVGQWEDAVDCYQKGLEVDDLAEEFYQRLMLCYQQLGLRGEAIAAYRRCRKALSSVLGVEPSPKTEAIYRSLCT